ncbi:MAG TPA: SIMPL domain-containing protein [Candidatus Paceibacterota bacterium]|nr:SIMPL domain-containing protein [Candidatus Paceibacterota bacterium]
MFLKKIFEDWRYAFGFITASILVVTVIFSIFLLVQAKNSFKDAPYTNTISVNGKGEVNAIPDIASFDFTVTEASESVESAQNISAEKINKAIDFLKQNGVEEKDIKSSNYSVYPKYEWIQGICTAFHCPPGRQNLVGYEVSQSINVKVRDTSKAGELLSGIGTLGISNVGGLSFTVDDFDSLKKEALDLAIKDARAKAEDLAKSLDVKLVKIISFNEENYYPYADGRGGFEGSAKSMDMAVAPNIPVGENVISSSVYVVYQIK